MRVTLEAVLQITALIDSDFDGVADTTCTLLKGLQNPNGIVWHKGALYVAETEKLSRFDGIDFAVLNGCNVRLHCWCWLWWWQSDVGTLTAFGAS